MRDVREEEENFLRLYLLLLQTQTQIIRQLAAVSKGELAKIRPLRSTLL